jgi:hypothetical protein
MIPSYSDNRIAFFSRAAAQERSDGLQPVEPITQKTSSRAAAT